LQLLESRSSKDVSIFEVRVCPLTASDHYCVSFTIKNAAPYKRETAVTWRQDLKSINRFELSSLKGSGLPCPFQHKFSQPDELVASLNIGLRKAVDAVAP